VHLARTHGSQLSALYVVDPYPYLGIGEVNPIGFSAYMNAAKEHAEKVHLHVQQISTSGGPAIQTQCLLRENLAASEGIIATAKECQCDLIIIGSHGRSGLSKLMLGSVANKVVSQSPIPVLVSR
jgi:nucleotide-binding universal stress UspA family protein